jgi:hypothetical protein
MIILGVILLIIGFVTGVAILYDRHHRRYRRRGPGIARVRRPRGRRPEALLLSNVIRLRMARAPRVTAKTLRDQLKAVRA